MISNVLFFSLFYCWKKELFLERIWSWQTTNLVDCLLIFWETNFHEFFFHSSEFLVKSLQFYHDDWLINSIKLHNREKNAMFVKTNNLTWGKTMQKGILSSLESFFFVFETQKFQWDCFSVIRRSLSRSSDLSDSQRWSRTSGWIDTFLLYLLCIRLLNEGPHSFTTKNR